MSIRAEIVERAIEPDRLRLEVAAKGNGATAMFIGTVRDVNDGRAVSGMEYSAYGAMAAQELLALAREVAARHDLAHLVVEHRIGALELGDVSVAIAAAHPHRAAAFAAARETIEEIKRRVPIWKRELYTDGTREWVGQDGRVEGRGSRIESAAS